MKILSPILVGLALTACAVPEQVELFVAPDGDDARSGTAAEPLATPAGALAAVRRMDRTAGVTVTFRDGAYVLSGPVTLTADDSGRPGAPVTWRAEHSGRAVFTAAFRPAAWRAVDAAADGPVYGLLGDTARRQVRVAEIPAGVALPGFTGGGCGTPDALQEIPLAVFQGAERLDSARWPDADFARTGAVAGDPAPGRSTSGMFRFDRDRLAKWTAEPEMWVYGLWRFEWADACCRVVRIDPTSGILTMDAAPIGFGLKEGASFHAVNAFSELDRPGEWAVDRRNRRLYVWPKPDLPDPVLVHADGLVRGEGLRDFVLEGFVFEHARLTALAFTDATNVWIRKSVVRGTGSWGAVFARARNCRVEGCDLYDLGEGGIRLDGGDEKTLTPGGNSADNNHVHHYGRVIPNYRQGVRLDGVGNRATHNLIHHSRHQAIEFKGNDHYVGWNVIHDTCQYNDDAGAVYCCQYDWTKRGTVVEHNLIHMTGKQPRATNDEAIYLDDYSSGTTVRFNVINRASSGVFIGGGHANAVYGNLFVNAARGVVFSSRGADSFARKVAEAGHASRVFKTLEANPDLYRGALWRTRYPDLQKVYDFDPVKAHDQHFTVVTNNVFLSSGDVEKGNWRNIAATTTLRDNRFLKEDPGFTDYYGMDWTVKDGGLRDFVAALRLDEMGLYASPHRVSPPVRFGAGLTPPKALRPEYALAKVRIDLVVDKLPAGVSTLATDCTGCCVPDWGGGRRIMALDVPAPADWTAFAFSFLPTFDGEIRLETMGARGEKTLFDDFRVEGSELLNPGFEGEGGWGLPWINPKDDRLAVCNTAKPFGTIRATEAKCPAAEGVCMACGNDMLNFTQMMPVRKGVRVSVSFKARALPE